jgi:hypothetical protein
MESAKPNNELQYLHSEMARMKSYLSALMDVMADGYKLQGWRRKEFDETVLEPRLKKHLEVNITANKFLSEQSRKQFDSFIEKIEGL